MMMMTPEGVEEEVQVLAPGHSSMPPQLGPHSWDLCRKKIALSIREHDPDVSTYLNKYSLNSKISHNCYVLLETKRDGFSSY